MGVISSALQTATAAVQTALGEIEKMIPSLPAMAQQPLQMALSIVTGVIDTVTNTLASFLSPASGDDTQSGGLLGSLISGPLGIVQNLLGGFLGREGIFGGLLGGDGGLFGWLARPSVDELTAPPLGSGPATSRGAAAVKRASIRARRAARNCAA